MPKVDLDHSIERYPAGSDTDMAADWSEQPNLIPGQIDPSTPPSSPTPTATLSPSPLPPLIINEIHADPDAALGDANKDGDIDIYDDEFIEIVNTTENPIDISIWEVSDLTGVRHVFSSTLVIPTECVIVIFGGGTPTGYFGGALIQVASTGKLYLNNDGDTLTLKDTISVVIDSHQYGSNAGDSQSITRDPDITGLNPMVRHSLANGSSGALFSPGTRIDALAFSGCSI